MVKPLCETHTLLFCMFSRASLQRQHTICPHLLPKRFL